MNSHENRVFYGWYVVAVAFMTNFMATGTGFYIFNALMSGIVSNTAVSNWFVEKRGRALGLATAGISLSGAILPILVADLYGRESFAAVSRFMSLFIILEGGGYMLMGQSFDRTGSYDTAYGIFVLLDLVAAGLVLSASRPVSSR